MIVNVAVLQYPVTRLTSWQDFEDKAYLWLSEAKAQGAQMVVFPEYASMELASLSADPAPLSLRASLEFMQSLYCAYQEVFARYAKALDLYIIAGSFPVKENELFYNRALVFSPEGLVGFQDKIQMTRFEKEEWFISPGRQLKVFKTEIGCFAINVCYDSEFPHLARQCVEAGADYILVPSCTDTTAGYYRVRVGCQARALENQIYMIQAPLVGEAPWSLAVDINVGKAGCFAPIDYGFEENGVMSEGHWNEPECLLVTLDLDKLTKVRTNGQVTNSRDWPDQFKVQITT